MRNNTEERIREDFASQLDMKDQQISDYQTTIVSLNDQLKENALVADMSLKEKEVLEATIQEMNVRIEATNKQAEMYKISNEALTASLALSNEKAQQNEEAAKNYLMTMNAVEETKKSYEQLELSTNQPKEQHKNEITLLQHDHEAELKQIGTQNQLDIKAAEETIKSVYQEKIDLLKSDYEAKLEKLNVDTAKRIDAYQEKLEKANEKLDVLRGKLQEETSKHKES